MTQTKTSIPEVRIYNRFQHRTLIHGKYRSAPNAYATVPEDVAKRWMEMFPEDIIEAHVAQKELTGVHAELLETKAELAKVKAALAAVKTDPKGTKALESANAKIRELEEQLTKPDPASSV